MACTYTGLLALPCLLSEIGRILVIYFVLLSYLLLPFSQAFLCLLLPTMAPPSTNYYNRFQSYHSLSISAVQLYRLQSCLSHSKFVTVHPVYQNHSMISSLSKPQLNKSAIHSPSTQILHSSCILHSSRVAASQCRFPNPSTVAPPQCCMWQPPKPPKGDLFESSIDGQDEVYNHICVMGEGFKCLRVHQSNSAKYYVSGTMY